MLLLLVSGCVRSMKRQEATLPGGRLLYHTTARAVKPVVSRVDGDDDPAVPDQPTPNFGHHDSLSLTACSKVRLGLLR